MGQISEKVVPSWDTDLTFRLQQLDNVLANNSTRGSLNNVRTYNMAESVVVHHSSKNVTPYDPSSR